MERCATGEHRGDTLAECAARVQAAGQIIIDERAPGWEWMRAAVRAGRDVWPHLCVEQKFYARAMDCDGPLRPLPRKNVCQYWTAVVRRFGWERVSESYRGLMEYVRELYPHLCAAWPWGVSGDTLFSYPWCE